MLNIAHCRRFIEKVSMKATAYAKKAMLKFSGGRLPIAILGGGPNGSIGINWQRKKA
jgi:hypothetical protein